MVRPEELGCWHALPAFRGFFSFFAAYGIFLVLPNLYLGFRLVADKKQGQGKSLVLVFGAPGGTRTRDLLIRSQALYPAELRAHKRLSFKPPKYHITFGRELQLIFCGSCFSFLKLSGYGAALRNSRQISCCTLFISCYCFASAAAPRSPPHPETAYCFRPAPRRPPRGH